MICVLLEMRTVDNNVMGCFGGNFLSYFIISVVLFHCIYSKMSVVSYSNMIETRKF